MLFNKASDRKCSKCKEKKRVWIIENGLRKGEIGVKCPNHGQPATTSHDFDIYSFPDTLDTLQIVDIQALLREANNGYPVSGNKDTLWRRLVEHRAILLSGELKSKALRDRLAEVHSLGGPFREPVHGMKNRCSPIDVNTGQNHSTYSNPEVDHKLELQLVGYAWNTMEGNSRRTRRQLEIVKNIMNDVKNLNVTTMEINRAKGAKGGAFNRAISNVMNDGVGGDHEFSISYFMTNCEPNRKSGVLTSTVQRNICRSVVNTWDEHIGSKLDECEQHTLKVVYKDNLHQLLFDKLKIDELN